MRQLRHPEAGEITLEGVLAALSDPVRLRIVAALAETDGERAWSDFDVEVGASTLSHHMKTLRLSGVIVHRKEGTRCFVSLQRGLDDRFPGLLACILGFVSDRQAGREEASDADRHSGLVHAEDRPCDEDDEPPSEECVPASIVASDSR